MKYKVFTYFLVFGCMLSGVALMAYADAKKRTLENSVPIETTQKCNKPTFSCKSIT